jgi:hypothetical protein
VHQHVPTSQLLKKHFTYLVEKRLQVVLAVVPQPKPVAPELRGQSAVGYLLSCGNDSADLQPSESAFLEDRGRGGGVECAVGLVSSKHEDNFVHEIKLAKEA